MDLSLFLDALQWPAMVATLVAAWLVGSSKPMRRRWGFVAFIGSNLLWIVWGWQSHAYALIVLQVGLFLLNARGIEKNQCEPDRELSL